MCDEKNDWVVRFALVTHEYTKEWMDKRILKVANLIVPHGESLTVKWNIEHLDSRISATCFVYFREWKRLYDDVKEDVDNRQIWKGRLNQFSEITYAFELTL